tara:strand:- start:48 stop:497 length:450 start_codon:yes stop_codon:yes gene_type:complete
MGSIITSGTKSRSGYSKIKSRPSHKRVFPTAWHMNPDNDMSPNNWGRQNAENSMASHHLKDQSMQRSGKNVKYVHREAGTNQGEYTPGKGDFAKPGTDVIEEEKYRKRKAGKSILKSVTTGAPWMGHPKRNLQWRFRSYAPTYKSNKGD